MNSRQRKKAHKLSAALWREVAHEQEAEINWLRIRVGEWSLEAAKRHTFDLTFSMFDEGQSVPMAPELKMTTPLDKEALKGWIKKYSAGTIRATVVVRSGVQGQDDLYIARTFWTDNDYVDLLMENAIKALIVELVAKIVKGE